MNIVLKVFRVPANFVIVCFLVESSSLMNIIFLGIDVNVMDE
jgi:hypothetical protein